jgi:hypothetical protein
MQFIEQFLGFLQIARVEPLRKPAVYRSKQFARACRTRGRLGLSWLLLRTCDVIKLGFFDDCGPRLTG